MSSETNKPSLTIGFAGNVTTQPFDAIGRAIISFCNPTLVHHDFGQPIQTLFAADAADFLVVHLDHRWFFDVTPGADSDPRMDELCAAASSRASSGNCTVILNTLAVGVSSPVRDHQSALRAHVARLNAKLHELAATTPGIALVDVEDLAAQVGRANFLRERNRYLMQFPYSTSAKAAIVEEYAAIIREHYQVRRKVVVVDADNTLWGGIVGELGAEGIGLSDDYPHVQHKIFQSQLKQLKQLGFLLVAVTKNNESDFRGAFAGERMPLSLDDFVTYRSNWNEKSDNILDVAKELNIGTDAVVFIDDNPFEVEEVTNRVPGVEGHVFPYKEFDAAIALVPSIASLRSPTLTEEDRGKTEQYRAEAERSLAQSASGSLEDYLASLRIELVVSRNHADHIPRIAQLTNKTNQFNLTTRRYTEAEIRSFMERGDVFDFRLIDKFGDMGIIGVVIVLDGNIDTLLLSCRALGRKVESEILRIISEHCGSGLAAEYIATEKNGQTAAFYASNGFEIVSNSAGVTSYRQISTPPASPYIKVRND